MFKRIIELNSGMKSVLTAVFGLLLLNSCEKVVDIDLNDKDPQIVIEGNINNLTGPYTVTIKKTANFDASNDFQPVSGATVTITDDTGYPELLVETNSGVYTTSKIQGTPGRTYTLKISNNGKEYSSVSTMPLPVNIDTLTVKTRSTPKQSDNNTIYINYNDPAGIPNYYRFLETINDVPQSTIYINDDLLQDGATISQGLFPRSQDVTSIKKGDKITISLQAVDKGVYEYFRTLLQSSITGLMGKSTSPANPLSNISNGALGYFNASSVSTKAMTVK